MFKNLKQKIAEGVEGVSPGRQTPLQASKPRSQNSTPSAGASNNVSYNNTPLSAKAEPAVKTERKRVSIYY